MPAENLREALLVKGVEVLGFTTLQEVVAFLEDRKEYQGVQKDTENLKPPRAHQLDFAEVQGQEAMNPCPCGYFGTEKCRCSDYEVVKYRQKLSGPILDRMDIQKYVQPVNFMEMTGEPTGQSSKELRERVERARHIQKERFQSVEGVNCNAQMEYSLIKEYCQLEPEGIRMLQQTYDRYKYSARTFHKFLKVARTFADLEESEPIRKKDVAAALMARDLEKDGATMMVV